MIATWKRLHFTQMAPLNSNIYGTYLQESTQQQSDAYLCPCPLGTACRHSHGLTVRIYDRGDGECGL
jgi:hypothetical protein